MKSITYIGGLPSGTLEDPHTRQTFPFLKGEPITVPDDTAAKLLSEQPQDAPDWIAAN